MTVSFRIDRILGDRPFAEVSQPATAVADQTRGLLAVAGTYVHEPHTLAPVVGVYDTGDLTCRALARARFPVHTLAFHPTLPLLFAGTGNYDGGYFFKGELLRLDWETGAAASLLEEPDGREVLGLEWLDDRDLRVLLAPPDDWNEREARVEGHVAVLHQTDWRAVPERSITYSDLAGPRVTAPRPDGRAEAVRLVTALSPEVDPRRHVRAVEELPDGRILATLDGIALEAWLPTGERQWTVPDAKGGRDVVVTRDGQSAWVGLVRPEWEDRPGSVVRLSLADGEQVEQLSPAEPVSVVRCADGRMALAPAGTNGQRSRLRIRHGSQVYFRGAERGEKMSWLATEETGRLFPFAWRPGETHFAGPGVEAGDGSLIHAGSVHHGHGLQPGGSFVVRRDALGGKPVWVFRTDPVATDLDADGEIVYVTYRNGEIVALDLQDGRVRWRDRLVVGAVKVVPTALTVTGTGRFLIGTGDGRVLKCSAVRRGLREVVVP